MSNGQELIEDTEQFFALSETDKQHIVIGLPPGTARWKWLFTPTAVWQGLKKLVVEPGAPRSFPSTVTSPSASTFRAVHRSPATSTAPTPDPQAAS